MARRAARELRAARRARQREARVEPHGEPSRTARRASWIVLAALVCGMTVVNFLWMPGEFLAADPHAWREEARSLLVHGELNVPAEYAKAFGEPGQYFVRNERTGLYYSKYGVGNVLFTLPPMWLQQQLDGNITAVGTFPSLLLFNLWYVALSAVLACLLHMLAAAYSRRLAVRVAFVLMVTYCTFLWYYQRAQSSELCQVILFTALFMSLVAFLRSLGEHSVHGLDRRAWGNLALVWVCAGLLLLIRVVYGLLLPLIVLLSVYAVIQGRSWHELRSNSRTLAGILLLPPLLIVGLLGVVNQVKFGAPWLTGYHQWLPGRHWPTGRLSDGVWGFLFSPRFSMFLYFPLLAFALFGVRRFAARHRLDAVVMLAIFAVFFLYLSSLPSWAGEWAYGPRYLLFILPVLSLPVLVFAEDLIERWNTWRARAWALVAIASLLYSAYLQVQVNRLPFYTYYNARIAAASPELIAYFYDRHVGAICDDLVRHRANVDQLPYFAELRRAASADFVNRYRVALVKYLARDNLYWALPPQERR
jgi:hypothetical protein